MSKEGLTIGHRALVKPEIPRVDRSPVLTPRIGDTLARGANLALAVHLDRLIKREGRREGRREWDARDDFKAFVAPFVGESVVGMSGGGPLRRCSCNRRLTRTGNK